MMATALCPPFLPYLSAGPWTQIRDGNPVALEMYNRHYSRRPYADGRVPALFVGPGEKLVLMTDDAMALFAWRRFISDDDQRGVCCAVFRNEGGAISSELIVAADAVAARRWPGERHYTYIDPIKTAARRSKRHAPGHCFLMAGWRACGITKKKRLVILERPAAQLEAAA